VNPLALSMRACQDCSVSRKGSECEHQRHKKTARPARRQNR
jgi:hypothetical protein